mmetsp:Transcript_3825/g.11296  ORF Transcript_3825/g.11296 Transcript_3825/m.11296 type:complete len:204 (+) Transcript_3825:233-844(+)
MASTNGLRSSSKLRVSGPSEFVLLLLGQVERATGPRRCLGPRNVLFARRPVRRVDRRGPSPVEAAGNGTIRGTRARRGPGRLVGRVPLGGLLRPLDALHHRELTRRLLNHGALPAWREGVVRVRNRGDQVRPAGGVGASRTATHMAFAWANRHEDLRPRRAGRRVEVEDGQLDEVAWNARLPALLGWSKDVRGSMARPFVALV